MSSPPPTQWFHPHLSCVFKLTYLTHPLSSHPPTHPSSLFIPTHPVLSPPPISTTLCLHPHPSTLFSITFLLSASPTISPIHSLPLNPSYLFCVFSPTYLPHPMSPPPPTLFYSPPPISPTLCFNFHPSSGFSFTYLLSFRHPIHQPSDFYPLNLTHLVSSPTPILFNWYLHSHSSPQTYNFTSTHHPVVLPSPILSLHPNPSYQTCIFSSTNLFYPVSSYHSSHSSSAFTLTHLLSFLPHISPTHCLHLHQSYPS